MKIQDIVAPLEAFAPVALAEDYDNPGLLVGALSDEVDAALVAVDITGEVLDEAAACGAGLVIAHHPLIFNPLKRLNGRTYIERAVACAVRRGIAVYACHTNLDSAPGGMSGRLASMLGIERCEVLDPHPGSPGAGFGIVGSLASPQPVMEYLALVRERLGCGCVRYSAPVRAVVERVALCTGAGRSLIEAVRSRGADLYISSDFRYNDFLDADSDLVIADVGHYESEYCAVGLICDIISEKIPNFALYKSSHGKNPVNYLV